MTGQLSAGARCEAYVQLSASLSKRASYSKSILDNQIENLVLRNIRQITQGVKHTDVTFSIDARRNAPSCVYASSMVPVTLSVLRNRISG